MLVFPKGIRLAESSEIPGSTDKVALIEKIRGSQIEQGYVYQSVNESLFSCYAEANIDAPQIWQVFRSLCEALLPTQVMPLIGEIDEEPIHSGRYDNKDKLLDLFEQFQFYLTNDGYLQFGLMAVSETELAEVFVTPTKQFQIWTNNTEALVKVMERYKISEAENLQFIDEFPRTTKALKYSNEFDSYNDLITYLIQVTGESDNE